MQAANACEVRALPPYAQLLNLRIEDGDHGPMVVMPFDEDVVGRPGFLHGAKSPDCSSLMDTTLGRESGTIGCDEPITVTVATCAADGRDTFATRDRALGTRIAHVEACAWQKTGRARRQRPINVCSNGRTVPLSSAPGCVVVDVPNTARTASLERAMSCRGNADAAVHRTPRDREGTTSAPLLANATSVRSIVRIMIGGLSAEARAISSPKCATRMMQGLELALASNCLLLEIASVLGTKRPRRRQPTPRRPRGRR